MTQALKIPEEEIEYRKTLIKESHSYFCPVMLDVVLDPNEGEIIYNEGRDHFISTEGINKLKELYGDEYIQEKIITYSGFK